MKEPANFQKDLKAGQTWEEWLTEQTFFKKNSLTQIKGKGSDFIFPKTQITLQLKTELGYVLNRENILKSDKQVGFTKNVFIERYSSMSKKSLGGPWQSQSHKTHYYAHLFPWDKIIFIWNTNKLVEMLDSMINSNILKEENLKRIPNKGYDTVGWPIPIKELTKDFVILK